ATGLPDGRPRPAPGPSRPWSPSHPVRPSVIPLQEHQVVPVDQFRVGEAGDGLPAGLTRTGQELGQLLAADGDESPGDLPPPRLQDRDQGAGAEGTARLGDAYGQQAATPVEDGLAGARVDPDPAPRPVVEGDPPFPGGEAPLGREVSARRPAGQ